MRKPRKTTTRKPRPTRAQPKIDLAVLKRSLKSDPFFIPPDIIPKNKSYQWVAISVLGESEDWPYETMVKAGWKPVPFKRHLKFFKKTANKNGKIVIGGQMLMEVSKAKMAEFRQADIDRAKEQMRSARGDGQRPGPQSSEFGSGVFYPINAVSQPYGRVPDDAAPIDVRVFISLRMSARLQDAANALDLSLQEYAQRCVKLHCKGEIGGLLMPVEGDAYQITDVKLTRAEVD